MKDRASVKDRAKADGYHVQLSRWSSYIDDRRTELLIDSYIHMSIEEVELCVIGLMWIIYGHHSVST